MTGPAPLGTPPHSRRWCIVLAVLVVGFLLLQVVPLCDGHAPVEPAAVSAGPVSIAPNTMANAPMGETARFCDGAAPAACCTAAIRQSSDTEAIAPLLAVADAGALRTAPQHSSGAGCRAPTARSVEGLLSLHCVWRT